nr:MAG TPA: hypothetical protein [Caudoviricetes sp.]
MKILTYNGNTWKNIQYKSIIPILDKSHYTI